MIASAVIKGSGPHCSVSASKRFISLEESFDQSRALGLEIARLRPRPDLIVGLANGGILPAIVAADTAGIECRIVRVRRLSSKIKQLVRPLRHLLRLPLMTAALRPAKSMSLALGRSVNRADVDTNLTFDPAGRKTVIVDDCVDSGISVARVRELLLSKGAASVQVAVLCWATKFDSEALHGVTPDIYLGRRLHYFPWALNNPEYSQFRDWVQKHGHASWR